MDVRGGHAAREKLDKERARILEGSSVEEKRRDQGDSKVVIIKKAGHHIYLDNPDNFNEVMLEEMDDVRRRAEVMKKGGD